MSASEPHKVHSWPVRSHEDDDGTLKDWVEERVHVSLVDRYNGLVEQYQAARTALEGVDVFYGEAISLIGELREDAELIYVADKGLPPHIEKARDLTDHEETLAQARAVLYPATEPEGD